MSDTSLKLFKFCGKEGQQLSKSPPATSYAGRFAITKLKEGESITPLL